MEKVEQTYKLPEGWIWTTIGEIGIVQSGGTPSTRNQEFWGNEISWITPADLSGYDKKYISKGNRSISKTGLDYSSAKLLPKGTILFSSRAPIGYTVIAKNELATNQGFKNLVPTKSLNSEYVYYYFQTLKAQAEKVASGTTFLELSATNFSKLPFPLAPFQEQQRIVSKIETLFSELEHAEKNLQKTKQQLETYRQSLLKKAFSGELSKKWRDENLEENKKSENKLPANWKYKKITSLSDFVGSGSTPKGGRNIYIKDGIPFIRSQNVLVNRLIEDDLVFISSEIHEKMRRTHTKPKDVLLNITGASIGRCAYIHESFTEGNVNQHVCIIRVNHKMIDYKYLTFFLNSPEAQLKIKQINTGATREALTLSQIKAFEIPICDMREQNVITQTLESQFTLIDNLNDTINKSVEEVVSLRHSTLKKAFEGKLVNQEPTDEPAQKLLELIKKEKIEYLKDQKENLLQKPKRILQMDSNKTVWQILNNSKIAMRTDKIWSESKHKDDIDAFYAEVKELIDSGKIVEDKRQGKVSYLKIK